MHLIRIEIIFDSGHRLLDYEGKCAFPHGHTYRAEVFLKASSLDSLGLVTLITDVEQRLEEEYDIALTLADDRAVSQRNSPFRSVQSLADYIALLIEEQQANDGA